MSAIQCWPQLFGQPVMLILTCWSQPGSRVSRSSTIQRAKPFVSVSASLQNSVPVQAMVPRQKGEPPSLSPAASISFASPAVRSWATFRIRRFFMLVVRSSHVGGTHPPTKDGETGVGVAVLLLGMDAHVVAVHVVGGIVGHRGLQAEADAALQLLQEALGRPAMGEEEELEPRLLTVLTQHVTISEDLRDSLDDEEDLDTVDEGVQTK